MNHQISPYAWPGLYQTKADPIRPKVYDPRLIIVVVCDYYKISLHMIKNGGRARNYALARHVAWYLIKQLVGKVTLKEMAIMTGGADHTTVLHGIKKIENQIPLYEDVANDVRTITALIKELE